MGGFARCEYFECGKGAVVGIKLDMAWQDFDGSKGEASLVLHYCGPCYDIVRQNEEQSERVYTELRDQGCSEKMANHVMVARLERER